MKKTVVRVYIYILLVMLVLAVYTILSSNNDVRVFQPVKESTEITAFSTKEVENEGAPTGYSYIYSFPVSGIGSDYNSLYVYTIHQTLNIYQDGELIYSVSPANNPIGFKSPGCIWSAARLKPVTKTSTIQIECFPVYENVNDMAPEIYLGESFSIIKRIMWGDALILAISGLIFMAGIVTYLVESIKRFYNGSNHTLLYAAIFVASIGLWKLLETRLIGLYIAELPILAVLPNTILLYLPIPYLMSMRAMYKEEEKLTWNVPVTLFLINFAGVFLLQFFKIADVEEMTIYITGTIVLGLLYVIFLLALKCGREGLNERNRLTLISTAALAVWTLADTGAYFMSDGRNTSNIGAVFQGVYFVLFLIYYMRQTKQQMESGSNKRKLERMALIDPLTGFYNRTASEERMQKLSVFEDILFVVCDLNSLKVCNDTFGHDEGDNYIKNSTRIIMECFGDLGQCYRMGGDEFMVIISGVQPEMIVKRQEEMNDMVAEFNRTSQTVQMGIACGYAKYDPKEDMNFADTLKRADKMMYEVKFRMKQAR